MAGRAPFFPTGANCKIRVNGVTLAYATDFSYSISVPHSKPKILGVYESASFEPMSYDVSGSFTIIKYTEGSVKRSAQNGQTSPNGANNDGNGVGSWTPNRGTGIGNIIANSIGKPSDGRANHSLVPLQLSEGVTFDIEIYQLVSPPPGPKGVAILGVAGDQPPNSIFGALLDNNLGNEVSGIARLRNCRVTNAAAQVQKRGVMTQTFQFIAQYADEDSFIADPSGQGQLEA